jgi:hypothetical protein
MRRDLDLEFLACSVHCIYQNGIRGMKRGVRLAIGKCCIDVGGTKD